MATLDTVLASVHSSQLSIGGLLRRLCLQGRLGTLVREAGRTGRAGRGPAGGLSVGVEELQWPPTPFAAGTV
jgi:hypothetical protein